MHICYITPEYPPETGWGGIATYTHEMAHGLVARGHQVTVLALAEASESQVDDGGVSVYRVLPRPDWNRIPGGWRLNGYWPGFAWAAWRCLRRVHARSPIDVVEVSEAGGWALPGSLGPRIPRVVRLHTARYFTDRHNSVPIDRKLALLHMMEKLSVQQAHAVTAPSRAMADLTSAWTGIRGDHVRIVPNPITTARFDVPTRRNQHEVLYVGRLETRKGMATLAAAIPSVLINVPNANVILLGKSEADAHGISWESRIREQLSGQLEPRVMFSQVPRTELPAVYARASLVVIPSLWENFPYVALEAMASGLPIVASNVGGLAEIVVDGETGRLVPPNDADALASAIAELLHDPETRERMGANAKRRVDDLYNTDRVLPAMIALYHRVQCGAIGDVGA